MNYNAALAHFPRITYSRYQKMIGYFSNLPNLWKAEIEEIVEAGVEENIAHEFLLWRDQNPIEKIEERLEKEGIQTISLGEDKYPKLLSEINDPPLTLFVRGALPEDELPTLAVVGTRRHTTYGKIICEQLTASLARQGMAIVSGLALGIDGIAHETALRNKGVTVAVLGSGVDRQHVYPAAHKHLADQIVASGGAVISEYPPGFLPTQYSFPARNRIVAGLSLGTLVIEAPESSGALITGKCALDYNREVMAVPHPVTSAVGAGCNELIKSGAKLITGAEDVTEALNLRNLKQIVDSRKTLPCNPEEEKILDALSLEPKQIDMIMKEAGLDSARANSTLTLMEMKGMIKNLGGMTYIKNV